MAAEHLNEYPTLIPFVLLNVKPTGKGLGDGIYGSIIEVTVSDSETVYAAKKFNEVGFEIPSAEIRRATNQCAEECQLMSTLNHRNIVKFLGVTFFSGCRLPGIVTERLDRSLHDFLDSADTLLPPEAPISLRLKCSILHDVGSGLAYLHEKSPPVFHHDLTARNILLNSDNVAKIADLGLSRVVPRTRNEALRINASVYMPPEVHAKKCVFPASIDVFSFGVVAVFSIGEKFPCNLDEPNYFNEDTRLLEARTELQRRSTYMRYVDEKLRACGQLKSDHPLIVMIKQCLQNLPAQRARIREVLSLLEKAEQYGFEEEVTETLRQEDQEQREAAENPAMQKGVPQRVNRSADLKEGGIPLHCIALSVILVIAAGVYVWLSPSSLPPVINKPLLLPPANFDSWRNDSIFQTRLWGTYRSNVYFGIRPRIPRSLLVGIMWYMPGISPIRHLCKHEDFLPFYGWLRHDGTGYGKQLIWDHGISLETEFMTMTNETWSARITGKSRSGSKYLVSLIIYLYNEGEGEIGYHLPKGSRSLEEMHGYTPELHQFKLQLLNKTVSDDAHHSYLAAQVSSAANLTSFVSSVLVQDEGPETWPPIFSLPGQISAEDGNTSRPNFIAYQVTSVTPFKLDIVMQTGHANPEESVSGGKLSAALDRLEKIFDLRFEDTFHLKEKGFNESVIFCAKAAFSNLIGGISYFYGQSKVISKDLNEPVDYWPAGLYTAVPSRSFFPRGFLWDEGFHQLITVHWDISITKDVLAHWLDLMNVEGWIPREQILGDEARSKVPTEFVVQHNENANPPTFFLTIEMLLSCMESEGKVDVDYLYRIYPRLQVWYKWLNSTQLGERSITYRWRGRNATTDHELNPKTMTSGLDDFPRATHPTSSEYHVDLYCWMALASGVMARIADLLGENSSDYWTTYKTLADPKHIDSLHWDKQTSTYTDYGLHSTGVKLVNLTSLSPDNPPLFKRDVLKEPQMRFVNSFGYVQLFPFLMKMIPPDSKKVGLILNQLRNTSLLWTDYGLRSLSKMDNFYNKYNTEQDPPYWRGAIKVNINYLAIRALHHYSSTNGPYQKESQKLYQQLRSNVMANIYRQFIKTNYIWEQYDDKNGKGKGTHPFTGWSSLLILIMAEKY